MEAKAARLRRPWFRAILRRRIFVILLLLAQFAFIYYAMKSDSVAVAVIRDILRIVSIIVAFHVVSKKDKAANKVSWIVLILVFPIFGGAFYLLCHFQRATLQFKRELAEIDAAGRDLFHLPGDAFDEAKLTSPEHTAQMRYLQNFMGFPVYDATQTRYFSPGEAFIKPFLSELKKAKKYIFLEYFIISDGVMWRSILDVLKEKARQGVEVRLIYDDLGCFVTLPKDYRRTLEEYGIKCMVFNPFRPVLTAMQNNRDHRKIAVIDGKVAFTGGMNLADEYINKYEKHGYWKDSAIKVEGKAAWSMTLMFLEMWELLSGIEEDKASFYPWRGAPCMVRTDGFVQPYADSPMDGEHVGEHVYLQMLETARDYVYITTPYLIVDDSVLSALCLAAKSGVDVRIITPKIWDKTLVHITTRSYYRELIANGVKVYEYAKGFMHSKTFVSDDDTATVGTINLDFRSMYLHFECGVWMSGTSAVAQVREDFLKTLDDCVLITPEMCRGNVLTRGFQNFLRLFAPLM